MTRSLFILLAGTSMGLILSSHGARAESLRDAVAAALAHHPSVEAARAGEEYSNEERREYVSDLFPEFSTSATGGRMYGNNSTSRGLTTNRGEAYSWLWEGNATLTQPIFDGMETFNRIDAAQARQTSSQYKVADAQETLALRAVQAYVGVLQAMEASEKIKNYQAKIHDYRGRIQEMVDQGAADEAEVAQAKNVALLLDNTLAETQAQLDTAYAAYREAVGKLPETSLARPDDPEAMILPTPEEALTHARAQHPVVLAAYKDMEAAELDVDAERGTLLPALDGELSYLTRDQKEEIGGEVTDGRALVRMTWDFSTGGRDLARIRKSKAAYSEKLAQSQQVLGEIEREIRMSYADMERAEKQKALSAERASIMKNLFDANETQFEGARVRLLQLMQSDNQLFGSELEKMNADYAHLLSEYKVLASTGRLQAALGLKDGAVPASSVVPVVDEPKAIDTKVEPEAVPPPAVGPVPAIQQIDDSVVHEGLLKEPAPKTKSKASPQKAVVIEPEEFPQEKPSAMKADESLPEAAKQEAVEKAAQKAATKTPDTTPVFDRVPEDAVPDPLPAVEPVTEITSSQDVAPPAKTATPEAPVVEVEPVPDAAPLADADDTNTPPAPVVIENERVYPDLGE